LLGYTKVLGPFHRQKYTCRLTVHRADGSFADFQKALRVRLNVPGNEPLVIKQIDGDYTLDIETGVFLPGPCCLELFIESYARTEEEYEAFCHFAKSASQLHISVNGGLKDQSKVKYILQHKYTSGSQRNKRQTRLQPTQRAPTSPWCFLRALPPIPLLNLKIPRLENAKLRKLPPVPKLFLL